MVRKMSLIIPATPKEMTAHVAYVMSAIPQELKLNFSTIFLYSFLYLGRGSPVVIWDFIILGIII